MLKRKHTIVAAAALAAAPLAAKAAITVTFAYDPTVTYSTVAGFTAGTTSTATIAAGNVNDPHW